MGRAEQYMRRQTHPAEKPHRCDFRRKDNPLRGVENLLIKQQRHLRLQHPQKRMDPSQVQHITSRSRFAQLYRSRQENVHLWRVHSV